MAGKYSDSSNTIDVDQIWKTLGRCGRYQISQALVLLVSIWSCGFHMLSFVFIAYRPAYECNAIPVNDSYLLSDNGVVKVEYGKCSVKTVYNNSGIVTTEEFECTSGWNYTYPDDDNFPVERSFVSEWNLVCDVEELTEISQTLVMFGQIFGAIISTSLADKYGRKPAHIASHILLFLITLVTGFAPNYTSFAVMRLLTGAAQQGIGLTGAILNLEIFPMEIRSNVEVAGLLFWSTGIALITPLAYLFRNMSWRYLQICLSCLSAWSLVEWWLIDESLRWLIANGKYDRAKQIIIKACKMNKTNYADVMLASGFTQFEMQAQQNEENRRLSDLARENLIKNGNGTTAATEGKDTDVSSKKYTVIDLVKSKRLCATSVIMWFAWATNSLTYYGIMLISSSLAGNRFLNFFLGSVVEYPAALIEYLMLNRFGRKPTCIMFHVLCCVSLLTATVLITTANGSQAMMLGSTIFILIGKFAITGSYSTIFLYTPELYPTNLRNVGIGLASSAGRIGSMLAPFARNLADFISWAPGLVFAIMCAIVAISMLWVPETNQRELPMTLAETEVWYKDNRLRMPGKTKTSQNDKNNTTK